MMAYLLLAVSFFGRVAPQGATPFARHELGADHTRLVVEIDKSGLVQPHVRKEEVHVHAPPDRRTDITRYKQPGLVTVNVDPAVQGVNNNAQFFGNQVGSQTEQTTNGVQTFGSQSVDNVQNMGSQAGSNMQATGSNVGTNVMSIGTQSADNMQKMGGDLGTNVTNFGKQSSDNMQEMGNDVGTNMQNFGKQSADNMQKMGSQSAENVQNFAVNGAQNMADSFRGAAHGASSAWVMAIASRCIFFYVL